MGRKEKNTVDYFPHYVDHGKTLFILERKYGNDGYAVWFKTLEVLGKSDNHFIDCRNTDVWEFMQAKMGVEEGMLQQIYDTCSKADSIHKELWENKVIWSNSFIKGIEQVYMRRNNSCMHFYDLCKHLSIKCKHKYDSEGICVSEKTQSKVKESIVYKYNLDYDKFLLDADALRANDKIRDEAFIKYKAFVGYLFGDNHAKTPMKKCLSLGHQISYENFSQLMKKYEAELIKSKIEAMENTPTLTKKYDSFYLTLNNWCKAG